MATQHFKRNFLNLYREEKISLVSFLLPLKRDKNVWQLQPLSSIWRPLAFLTVNLSPPPGEPLNPGIEPGFPVLQVGSLPDELPGKPIGIIKEKKRPKRPKEKMAKLEIRGWI